MKTKTKKRVKHASDMDLVIALAESELETRRQCVRDDYMSAKDYNLQFESFLHSRNLVLAASELLAACKEAREFQRLLGADQDDRLTKTLDTAIVKAEGK